MQTVTSRDGTPIAFWQSGSGPPLLLVHGATADHSTTWRIVGPLLAERRTVLAMDRRGRGGSGDGPDYAIDREAEDVAAVLEAIGRPTDLLGHSHGGLCALEGARLAQNVRRMILYEPAIHPEGAAARPEVIDRIEAQAQAGDREAALVTMLRDMADMTPQEIEIMRSQAEAWEARKANVGTVPREVRALARYVFDPARFADVQAPTLVMVGGDSAPFVRRTGNEVVRALPNARLLALPGQQHGAMYTAPDLFVAEVMGFLEE